MAILEPTNLLLLACALVYGLIGEPQEALILLGFVAAISLLDAWQQRRSQMALAELARLSSPRARVQRNGVDLELPPEEVQRGDLLRLDEGDRVAADALLREGVGMWLDTSLLTGESLPVEVSQPAQLIRAGSLVASGRGLAEVVAVGEATELGRLGRSLASVTPPPTRLQRHTRRLTARLTVGALALCACLAVLQGGLSGDWSTALLAALALALAVLPNEIPVVLALFLALGALRLARIGVLARRPAAVESLGSATVLAVDKTGTLTENRMAVQQLLTWPDGALWQAGEPLEEPWHRLLELAVLASPGLMQVPPRPPDAPLFGPTTWRHALVQGGVMAALALAIAFWPDLSVVDRRSLLFTLLLLGGGVLVWLNGEPRSRISQLGGAIGLGLWLLVQVIPGLNSLLLLRPLQEITSWVLLVALVILLLSNRFSTSTGLPPPQFANR